MPNVVLVCGEVNRMTDSILWGIASSTPTYFPPPASTIKEISASLGGNVRALPHSLVDEPLILLLIALAANLFPH